MRGLTPVDEHEPVLVDEVLEVLAPSAGGFYVDGTFGRGGHTARLLHAVGATGSVLAIDRDPAAIAAGRQRFHDEPRLQLAQGPFAQLAQIVAERAAGRAVRGILLDLGVSSPQLDDPSRGFSFSKDGPLDMRMDPDHGESAAEFLARADAREIAMVIAELGEERFARRIAAAIVETRSATPLLRTRQLAELVQSVVRTRDGKHPATRTFQALRMHVNDELGQLRAALEGAHALLAPGGRLAVISFHSLEDRIVKQALAQGAESKAPRDLPIVPDSMKPWLRLITRGAEVASESEIESNPRAPKCAMLIRVLCCNNFARNSSYELKNIQLCMVTMAL